MSDEAAAEAEPLFVDACGERPLKFRAMNSAIGRAETSLIGAAKADGMGRDPCAGAAVAINKFGRLGRRCDDRIKKPKAFELACARWPKARPLRRFL